MSDRSIQALTSVPEREKAIARLWARRSPGKWQADGCTISREIDGHLHCAGAMLKASDSALVSELIGHWPDAVDELESLRACVACLHDASVAALESLSAAGPSAVAELLELALSQAKKTLSDSPDAIGPGDSEETLAR